jgi:hypothetical protein
MFDWLLQAVGLKKKQPVSALLRQDSGYILRQDAGRLLLEK